MMLLLQVLGGTCSRQFYLDDEAPEN